MAAAAHGCAGTIVPEVQHLSHCANGCERFTILQSVIFGFNTDVRHGDTVYHVQSETQQHDTLLQTHIFVGGQCLGRCELSLADGLLQSVQPDAQEVLRRQHRQVLDCVRQGRVTSLLTPAELALEWLEASAEPEGDGFALLFRVTASGCPLGSAYLVCRLDAPSSRSAFAEAETTAEGCATVQFAVQRGELENSTLLIEASHAGRRLSSRFLLHARQQTPAVSASPMF